jgi:sugar/nucleoside kinase (ribokinase family)
MGVPHRSRVEAALSGQYRGPLARAELSPPARCAAPAMENAGRLGALAAAEVIQHIGARPQVSLKELAQQNGCRAYYNLDKAGGHG